MLERRGRKRCRTSTKEEVQKRRGEAHKRKQQRLPREEMGEKVLRCRVLTNKKGKAGTIKTVLLNDERESTKREEKEA